MLNKVLLMGRLTKDPEIRYTSGNNIPVARFTVAVDRNFVKQGEERQADFINCTAWNKTAEFINNYFTKGRAIVICGRLQTGSYEKDGVKHYTTDVVADEVYFGDSKANSTGTGKPQTDIEQESEGFFPVDTDDELPF